MPIGCVSLIPSIVEDLAPRHPAKVLDLGIGFGMWGAVIRQWLDMGVRKTGTAGRHDIAPRRYWGTYLMGVEGHAAYKNPCWDLYDFIHVMSIQEYLAGFPGDMFDAILLLDVLEHFDVPDGDEVLRGACARLAPNGVLYVGTPGVWCEQGASHGNDFERHRSLWNADMLCDRGFAIAHMHVRNAVHQSWFGGEPAPTVTPAMRTQHVASYSFDGQCEDPWGNIMLLAQWQAPPYSYSRAFTKLDRWQPGDDRPGPGATDECAPVGAPVTLAEGNGGAGRADAVGVADSSDPGHSA